MCSSFYFASTKVSISICLKHSSWELPMVHFVRIDNGNCSRKADVDDGWIRWKWKELKCKKNFSVNLASSFLSLFYADSKTSKCGDGKLLFFASRLAMSWVERRRECYAFDESECAMEDSAQQYNCETWKEWSLFELTRSELSSTVFAEVQKIQDEEKSFCTISRDSFPPPGRWQ